MLLEIAIGQLEPWPGLNPRKRFDPDRQAELVESVRTHGILQPVVAHNRGTAWTDGAPYWIIAGERRYRAALEAGLTEVPVHIGTFTEAEAVQLALIENLQRADMTVVEEARGYQRALESGMTQAELASQLGIAQPTIANRIRLLQLPLVILDLIEDGVILASHARDLLLPFTGIPEVARKMMFADLIQEVLTAAAPISGADLEVAVRTAAIKVSRPIGRSEMIWKLDSDCPHPLFEASAHKACECRGPRFAYQEYHSPRLRCFDGAWWDGAQAAARAAKDAELAAKLDEARPEAPGQRGGIPIIAEREFLETRSAGGYESLTTPWYGPALVDVDEVPRASLVVLTDSSGERPRLVSTDIDATKRAISAAEKEKRRRVEEARAVVVADELAEMERREVEPWMLQRVMISRPDAGALVAALRDLGIPAKHGEGYTKVNDLSMRNIEKLFRLLAIRARDGRLSYTDPIEERIEKEMRAELEPKLLALLPAVEEETMEEDEGAVCLVCLCTELNACEDGCWWAYVDHSAAQGICDACEPDPVAARELYGRMTGAGSKGEAA